MSSNGHSSVGGGYGYAVSEVLGQSPEAIGEVADHIDLIFDTGSHEGTRN